MKWVGVWIFSVLIVSSSTGQQGACEIQSVDSTLFKLTVKGISLGDTLLNEWRFAGDPGVYEVHIFPGNQGEGYSTYLPSTVEIVEGTTRTYDLFMGSGKGEFALGISSEVTYRKQVSEILLTDTALLKARGVELTDAAQFPPLENPDFDQLLNDLRSAYFQNERASLIRGYLSGHQVSVEELRQMLASIDAEDRRLDLALAAAGSLTTPGRLMELEDLFYLNSSKDRLKRVAGAAGE